MGTSESQLGSMAEEFSTGKQGAVVPADPKKVRITIRLDADVVDHFKNKVIEAGGGNYQTLINNALRQIIDCDDKALKTLEDRLRQIIREELRKAS